MDKTSASGDAFLAGGCGGRAHATAGAPGEDVDAGGDSARLTALHRNLDAGYRDAAR